MKALLYKEFRLVTHPTTVLFLLLSAMLLIPNYPLYVTFFYCTLGLFFAMLSGRENQDIAYSVLLPVRKRDLVRARMLFAVCFELMQIVLSAVFCCLRVRLLGAENAAGMDANLAFFGLSFVLLGLFNFVFFIQYYRDPAKVGKAFAIAAIVVFLYIGVVEALSFIVPFFKNKLDTPDPQFLSAKLFVLFFGLLMFALLTAAACKLSESRFEKLDV